MHLPHIDEALVLEPKISGYLLADDHPAGRSKARFFKSLGFCVVGGVGLIAGAFATPDSRRRRAAAS